jgi:hypothetical protein
MSPATTQALAAPRGHEAVTGGSTGANVSLFHGASALEFVPGRAGRDVQAAVDRLVAARLAAAARRCQLTRLPSLAEFGLIGDCLGAVVDPRGLAALPAAGGCADLPGAGGASGRRRWLGAWCSPDSPTHEQQQAGGHGNNRVAHGIGFI